MLPPWVTLALKAVGTREIPGKATAPAIARWLTDLKAWWRDDETPWCGVFAGWCMKTAGWAPPNAYYRALAWVDWGDILAEPRYGAVAIIRRPGGGHVFFVLGRDRDGRIIGVGGNQRDAVSVASFAPESIVAFRSPPGFGPYLAPAPILANTSIPSAGGLA